MSNETKRDLAADLRICEAATSGSWKWCGDKFGDIVVYSPELRGFHNNGGEIADLDYGSTHDATFIAEARTGWPHAIERALAAEAEVEVYREAYDYLSAEIERLQSVISERGAALVVKEAMGRGN